MKSCFFLLAAGLLGAAIASAQVPSTLANISSRGLVGSSSVTLPPGAYTVAATSNSPDAADGTALVEVYDADSVSSPQQ